MFKISEYTWLKKNLSALKWRIVVEILFLSSFAFVPIISAKLSQYAIDEIILQQNFSNLYYFLVYCLIFLLIILILKYLSSWICAVTRQRFILGIRRMIWEDIVNDMPVDPNPQFHSGDLVNRLTNDVNSLGGIVISYITFSIVCIFSLVIYSIAMLNINLCLSLIAFMCIPWHLLLFFLFKKKIYLATQRTRFAYDQMLNFLTHRYEHLEEIRILKGGSFEIDNFRTLLQEQYNVSLKALFLKNYSSASIELVGTAWHLLLFGTGAYFVISQTLSLGELIAFLAISSHLLGPIQQILGLNISLQTAHVSINRINHFVKNYCNPEQKTISSPPSQALPSSEHTEIILHNVILHPEVIKEKFSPWNMSFQITDRLYLIGKNGSGKSSLCKIFAGLDMTFEGEIYINGMPLAKGNHAAYSSQVMLLTHSPYFFHGTIYENLLFGHEGNYDKKMIRSAIDAVFLSSWIDSLPGGLNYVLTNNANNLSRGQKLRLHCVRALLKNPDILILDEILYGIEDKYQSPILDALAKDRRVIITATSNNNVNSSKYAILYMVDL